MEEKSTSWPLKIAVAILFLFLLVPVLVIIPLSFSGESTLKFPPASWSFRWYAAIFEHEEMLSGFRVSVVIGALVTSATLLIALPAAYVIVRLKSWGSEFFYNLFGRASWNLHRHCARPSCADAALCVADSRDLARRPADHR
jgi:putative spermidine/putrescine transport system permease protein